MFGPPYTCSPPSLFQSGSPFKALNFHILNAYIPTNAVISAFQVRNAEFRAHWIEQEIEHQVRTVAQAIGTTSNIGKEEEMCDFG